MPISTIKTIQYMYYYIFYFFLKIAFSLGLYVPPKIETILDNDAKYILPIKTRFLKHFENMDKNTINFNENIKSSLNTNMMSFTF